MVDVRPGSLLKSNPSNYMKHSIQKIACLLGLFTLVFSSCSVQPEVGDENATKTIDSSTRFAYVTNGVDPFWDLCAAVRSPARISHEVLMPPKGVVDQKRMMETLLANGVDGVAVSPIDAENQTPFLNEVAENTILITQDADAPMSNRLVYIGANNYKAGRALGKLVKDAIPDGGEVMLFVGRLEQLNARQRRQGVIDELLNRSAQELDQVKYDPVDSKNLSAEGSKYVILIPALIILIRQKQKQCEDAITKYKDLKCMVGLFAYNPCLY